MFISCKISYYMPLEILECSRLLHALEVLLPPSASSGLNLHSLILRRMNPKSSLFVLSQMPSCDERQIVAYTTHRLTSLDFSFLFSNFVRISAANGSTKKTIALHCQTVIKFRFGFPCPLCAHSSPSPNHLFGFSLVS